MRAVFLDVDGVLLPFGEGPAPGTQTECAQDASKGAIGGEVAKIPHASLAALARILRETGAQVVLSSTWRCAGGAEALVEAFREFARLQHEALAGPTCPLGAIAETGFVHTTDPGMHSHRQWEIAAWLESAASSGIVVQSWCALDDEELVSVDPAEGGGDFNARFQALFQGRHVKTPSHIGLTDAHATAAIKQLQRPCTHAASTNGGSSRAEGATGATGGSSAARKTRDDHKASKGGRERKHECICEGACMDDLAADTDPTPSGCKTSRTQVPIMTRCDEPPPAPPQAMPRGCESASGPFHMGSGRGGGGGGRSSSPALPES